MKVKTKEVKTSLIQVYKLALFRMKLQLQAFHDSLNCLHNFLRLPAVVAYNDKIVTVSDKLSQMGKISHPIHIQDVQIDISQKRADNASLRRSAIYGLPFTRYHDSRLKPTSNQLQHSPIADSSCNQRHEQFVIQVIEEASDICVNDLPAEDEVILNLLNCLHRAAFWSEPIGAILKIGLEYWLDYDPAGLLNDSVANSRDTQRSLTSIGFGNIHTLHWKRPVFSLLKLTVQGFQKISNTFSLYDLQGFAVDSGSATVRLYFYPGPPLNIRPVDAVIQRMEAPIATLLGREVELALELS